MITPTLKVNLRTAIKILITTLLLPVSSALILYSSHTEANDAVTAIQVNKLHAHEQMITTHFKQGRSQITFLASVPAISGIMRSTNDTGIDPLDQTPLLEWKKRLQTIFIAYTKANPVIRQIRYIGYANNGMELVRVDRKQGSVYAVSSTDLQHKNDTSYYKEIQKLPPNTIYLSKIELNREHGDIEFPEWPTFREAISVYDAHNKPFGFVIINYDATDLLAELTSTDEFFETFLLNEDLNFIVHPDKEVAFSMDRGNPVSWRDLFNSDFVYNKEQPTTINDPSNGELNYISKRITVSSGINERTFYLVEAVHESFVVKQSIKTFLIGQSIITIIFLIAVSLLFFYHRALREKIQRTAIDKQYQTIFNGTSEIILLIDKEGYIFRINNAGLKTFGSEAHNAIKIDELIPSSVFDFNKMIGNKDNDTINYEIRLQQKTYLLGINAIKIDESTKPGYLIQLRDITTIKNGA